MATTKTTVEVQVVPTVIPTQVAYAAKATLRTLLAVLVGAGVVVPLVLAAVQDQLGAFISPSAMGWIVSAAALIVAVSGTVTRIMAIPQINTWLTKIGLGAVPAAVANDMSTVPVVGTITTGGAKSATAKPAAKLTHGDTDAG